jgi:hypothetical protein
MTFAKFADQIEQREAEMQARRAARRLAERRPDPTRPPKVRTRVEKAVDEQHEQHRLYEKWQRDIRERILRGEFRPNMIKLLRLLKRSPDAKTLVGFIAEADWLRHGDAVMRGAVLGYVDEAMVRWQIRHGLSPFDDGIPPELSAFVEIRRMLTTESERA